MHGQFSQTKTCNLNQEIECRAEQFVSWIICNIYTTLVPALGTTEFVLFNCIRNWRKRGKMFVGMY